MSERGTTMAAVGEGRAGRGGEEMLPRLGGHIPALDGLRGMAVLLVLVHHFGLGGNHAYPRLFGAIFFSVTGLGWVGVDLFFVLSGFLITGILHDSKESAHYFRDFYMRRVLRIFPLYYGALLLTFVVLPLIFGDRGVDTRDQGWLWLYASNVRPLFTEKWFEAANGFGFGFGHFWSLAVEEHFYMLWPLVVYLTPRRWLVRLCVGLMCLALACRMGLMAAGYQGDLVPYVFTLCRVDALATGAWIALVARGPGGLGALVKPARWMAGVGGVVLAGLWWRTHMDRNEFVVACFGVGLLAWFFGALLVLVVAAPRRGVLGGVFQSGVMRFFGRYSYGIYVFHAMLANYFRNYSWFAYDKLYAWSGNRYLVSILLYVLLATAATLVIAVTSWHLYENQFLKLKKYFDYRGKVTAGRVAAMAGGVEGQR